MGVQRCVTANAQESGCNTSPAAHRLGLITGIYGEPDHRRNAHKGGLPRPTKVEPRCVALGECDTGRLYAPSPPQGLRPLMS